MQKAAAIMQFKLEGQVIERNPQWDLGHRRLLHRIDLEKGTIVVDGVTYELRDRCFPTLDVRNPYAAFGGGAGLHGSAAAFVFEFAEVVGAHAVHGGEWGDVSGSG